MRALICLAAAAATGSSAFAQAPNKSGYSLATPTPRDALRELSTARSVKTESPYTVDAGHLQIEMDFATYTCDTDRSSGQNIRSETLRVAPVNFKMGLPNSTDLHLLVDPYVRQTVKDRATGTRGRLDGFGDTTLRLKHNLCFMADVDLLEESDGQGYAATTFINSATMSFDIATGLAPNLRNKVSRGRFTAVFLLQCLKALDAEWIHIPASLDEAAEKGGAQALARKSKDVGLEHE
jgi:hypothetical protein